MNNIISYANENLEKLNIDNFNEVDSLILSCISYYSFPSFARKWKKNKLKSFYKLEYFDKFFTYLWDTQSYKKLFSTLCASPRFRDLLIRNVICSVDFEEEKQFSALCIEISKDLFYVSFRGTNSTFVGWKEDFNMSFKCPIPAQLQAVDYLNELATKTNANFILGGHSKGGNLAIYAALYCNENIKDRIINIYSHDGPGFFEEIIQSEEYQKLSIKIHKTIPQSSIIGLLLENKEVFNIIRSNRNSIFQHDPFSWQVEDKHFIRENSLTKDSIIIDKALKHWLKQINRKEREEFIDTVYEIINSNNLYSFYELKKDLPANLKNMIIKAHHTDAKSKKLILAAVTSLVTSSIKAVFD